MKEFRYFLMNTSWKLKNSNYERSLYDNLTFDIINNKKFQKKALQESQQNLKIINVQFVF